MKRCKLFLLGLIMILTLLGTSILAFAEETMWSDEYYRAYDTTGTLSDAEKEEVDQIACDFVSTYHIDLVAMTMTSEDYEDSLEEEAKYFYENNGFGYGEDASGVICAFDADTSEIAFVTFGAAKEEVPEKYLEVLKKYVPGYYEKHKAFGVMYVFESYMKDLMEGVYDESLGRTSETSKQTAAAGQAETAAETKPVAETKPAAANTVNEERKNSEFWKCLEKSGIDRVGDGNETRPYWYPVSTENFPFYNDPDISRVVDDADIFTEEEEAKMRSLIAKITEETQHDIVIFTDKTDYGLGHALYAADFYDFNGYGIGKDNEGMCLMICMDPENRGWWACATGSDSRMLYSEDNANALDDKLYEYMVNGEYGEGVLDWIGNIRTLYVKGIPFAPDWYPDRDKAVEKEDPAKLLRVADDAGLFTAEQLSGLSAEAKTISDKYGLDIVIHTAESDYGLGTYQYEDLFYQTKGYGFGENHDGLILTLFAPGYAVMSSYGKGADKLSEVNYDRIMDYTWDKSHRQRFYEAAKTWLKHVEHMERTGRVAKNGIAWAFNALLAELLAFVSSWFALRKAKKKMLTIRLADNADPYLVGQPILTKISDVFLRSYESKKAKPKYTSSSSSSTRSSSGSSYSSSYSGSSGRSHSGSGRSF